MIQLLALLILLWAGDAHAVYDLPNDRQVPWLAGSDQWNGGSLPNRTEVTCEGLTEGNGTTDNAPIIQNCLDNAPLDTAVKIPAGMYFINAEITIPTGRSLRGAGGGVGAQGSWLSNGSDGATAYSGDTVAGGSPTVTTFKLGSGGAIFSGSTCSCNFGSLKAMQSGYSKGSQSITMAAGHGFAVNDWISVFEDNDPALVSTVDGTSLTQVKGDDGVCNWCGDNNGNQTIQQFVQVTGVSGDVITISRPLYYTYQSQYHPSAKKIGWGAQKAGIEHLKLNGNAADHGKFIHLEECLFCWVVDVETYNAGSGSKAFHIYIAYSHGIEVRDSYLHRGRGSSSDRNYGLDFFWWNSDHKVENNIFRHHRHSLSFDGGGSGVVVLYNYIDDNWEEDQNGPIPFLGSARINHGAHPMQNLYEGNWASHIAADSIWGSSSHITLFRNWLRGEESFVGVPVAPTFGFIGADIAKDQKYYNVVGNVLGVDTWPPPPAGTIRNSGDCGHNSKTAYYYGCDSNGNYSATTFNSIISHGNYDYVSDSVAFWEGGADHTLKNSMYYSAKPAFFNSCAWPVFGPEPTINDLPAKKRFDLGACVTGPIISNVASGSITGSGATITWTTDEASDSQVEYGTTTAYESSSTLDTAMVTSHSVALTNLTPSTLYHYRVKSRDIDGNLATSGDFSFPVTIMTDSLPDGTPSLSYSTGLTAGGGNTPYTWSIAGGALPTGLSLASGSGTISGTPTTTGVFSFTVRVTDSANPAQTADKALSITIALQATIWPSTTAPGSTAGPDNPVELGVKFRSDVDGSITGIRFYKASTNTSTHVGNLWTVGGALLATATFTGETASGWQQVNFSSPVTITANTVYVASYHTDTGHYSYNQNYFATTGVDNPPLHALANGVSGGNGVFTYGATSLFPSSTFNSTNYWVDVVFVPSPPIISNVASGSITGTGATITWTTNEASDSQVEYGTTTAYGSSTTLDPAMVTSHSVTISGLTSETPYHFRVKSKDPEGIPGFSGDFTFTTLDITPPIISNVASGGITGTCATITWTTNELSDSQVEYGTTTAYGSSTTLDPAMVTSHSVALTNLTPSTPYHYRVKSRDAAGNLGVSGDATFTTTTTLWPSTAVPGSVAGPGSPVELGVKFRSDVNGSITGIRFYKASTNTGIHVANFWTITGTKMATATFVGETASGWQQVNFSSPVAITANTVYVASYHTNTGSYSYNYNYFATSGVDNPPLHALANGVSGGNGVFTYGSGSLFPSSTFNSTNYWVDVVFVPSAP